MKEEQTRSRAIADISNLRFRARQWQHVDRQGAGEMIDKAFSLWMRAGGDPMEEEFAHVMGRIALHAMAHRQIELAHTIIEAGYAPCRDAWILASGRGQSVVGGLAHCLAGMEAEGRLKTNLPDRAQVLEAAMARPDWWAAVVDVDGLHHGFDALVTTESSHWRDLRKRRGCDNAILHVERVSFQLALIKAGCPVARDDTHHGLLAAAIPEFASTPADTLAGLEHMRRVISWGGAGLPLARASAWTAAIRRDVRQVLDDATRPGPRVALLDELGVALEAPRRSHVHAGVVLAALQKAYIPVVDRLVADGQGFDWLDDNDKGGILAKLGGGKQEVANAVARVPVGWLAPQPESRVNAINVQVANCNVGLLERAIAEGWPLADAMGQRKTPFKTIAGRGPSPTQTPEAMRATLRCLVNSCAAHGIEVPVDGSLLKLAVGLRDVESLETMWGWAKEAGIALGTDHLIQACCRAQLGAQTVEMRAEKAVEVFEFLWARRMEDPAPDIVAKWLGECLAARNRILLDRVAPLVGEVAGSAWPASPHADDMARIEDLGHMVETMASKGADAQPPNPWLARGPLLGAVLAVRSRQLLAAETPHIDTKPRATARI